MIESDGTVRGDIDCMLVHYVQETFEMPTFARWFRLRWPQADRNAIENLCARFQRQADPWQDAVAAFVALTGQGAVAPTGKAPVRRSRRWWKLR